QANRPIRMDTIVFPGQSEGLQVVPIPDASVLRREIAGFNDVRPPLPGILGPDLCRSPFLQRQSLCYIDELLDADAIRDDDRPDSDFGRAPGEVNFDFILRPGTMFRGVPVGVVLGRSDRLKPELSLGTISQQRV